MSRDRLLPYSVLLNLVLAVACGWFAWRQPGAGVAPVAAPVSVAAHPAGVSSMRWDQLESTDYTTYMANLRAFGCPPETIRDIIIGDVESLFAQKRKEAQDETWAAGADPKEKLAALRRDELQLIGELLGPDAQAFAEALHSGAETAYDTAPQPAPALLASPAQRRAARIERPPTVPLALIKPDPSLKLTEDQQYRLQTLRDNFVAAIGGTNQNTSDPAYLKRWRQAQADADDQLRSYFGQDLYYKFQLQAIHSDQYTAAH
jgi:hypothetical protein